MPPTPLSKVFAKTTKTVKVVHAQVVEKKDARNFVIADATGTANLTIKTSSPSQAKYFKPSTFIKIVKPGIERKDETIIIESNTAIFLGSEFDGVVESVKPFVEVLEERNTFPMMSPNLEEAVPMEKAHKIGMKKVQICKK